ncbi:hypothetical protein LEUCIP111803_02337 [Leucobacter soli]|uniref:LysR substrate-binding domain-containing protein n=1 Tax=Leucobacter soli TaxID=2812850 RepID=A0A916K0T2_9MICO|nr:LysR substrate-binding domain-containing protein [Leucobacter soli]CAG7620005.1 hypothetical protein LEUCIP111803_02337 [Leucobacter soli]
MNESTNAGEADPARRTDDVERTPGDEVASSDGAGSAGPRASEDHPADRGAPPLRVGFARGVAPGKWARRWADSGGGPLELVPLPVSGRAPAGLDIVLERVPPGERPTGTAGGAGDTSAATGLDPARLAVHLYEESLALVVAADHELAGEGAADRDALALVTLLAHPDHATAWPDPAAWEDPSWAPRDAAAALDLVATGLGAILLPLPLARHLGSKRAHAVLPLRLDPPLPGTTIWASWAAERDAADVQRFIGTLRGRTARSGRGDAEPSGPDARDGGSARDRGRSGGAAGAGSGSSGRGRQSAPKPKLPKNSRGAQLAAAKARRRGKR